MGDRLRFLVVALLLGAALGQEDISQDPSMDAEEAEAVFQVLEAINPEIGWRELFPGDNPCTGGPHGVNCDLDNDTLHVVELNFGWVSEIVNNPPCAANATIHRSILKFRHLRKLFFYQCFVGEPMLIPDEISQLGPSLLHLTFQDNAALVGGIPPSLSKLVNLERLVLTENNLGGGIPHELGSLRNLKQLVLSHNRFNGTIPPSLGALDNLMILDLSSNALSGSLPEELGSLASLEKLDVSMNLLQGEIPSSVGSLPSELLFLDLSHNNLSGGIPDSFSALSSLQSLFLRDNPLLGGTVPRYLGSLSDLEMLALSGSGFRGSIPDTLGDLSKLNSLALDGNRLSGSIPPSINRLRRLYHLNLSSNGLSGPLPFSSEFVSRLGRNLVVRNNSGLCHAGIMDEKESGVLSSGFGVDKCEEFGSSSGLDSTSQQRQVSSLVSGARISTSELPWWIQVVVLVLSLRAL